MSSDALAIELLKRYRSPIYVLETGTFDGKRFVEEAQGWSWGNLRIASSASDQQRFDAIVWAEPSAALTEPVLARINQLASPRARMNIICSHWVGRYIPEWQRRLLPVEGTILTGKLFRLLSGQGWEKVSHVAFHGPRSIVWSYLVRLFERIGRPDWSDRCLFAMRKTYRESGWLALLSTISMVTVKKL